MALWIGFSFFITLDDYSNRETFIFTLPICLVVCSIFAILYTISSMGKSKKNYKSMVYNEITIVLSGILASMGFATCLMCSFDWKILFSILLICLCLVYVVPNYNDVTIFNCNIILILIPTLTLAFAIVNIPFNIMYTGVVLLGILLVASRQYFQLYYDKSIVKLRLIFGFISMLLTLCTMYVYYYNIKSNSQIINAVTCLFSSYISFHTIKNNFATIINAENNDDSEKLKIVNKRSYLLIVIIGIGCFLYFLITLSSFAEMVEITNILNDREVSIDSRLMIGTSCLLMLSLLIIVRIKSLSIKKE